MIVEIIIIAAAYANVEFPGGNTALTLQTFMYCYALFYVHVDPCRAVEMLVHFMKLSSEDIEYKLKINIDVCCTNHRNTHIP